MKNLIMKCGECGKFISKREAEETTGRLADCYRGRGVCKKCLFEADRREERIRTGGER